MFEGFIFCSTEVPGMWRKGRVWGAWIQASEHRQDGNKSRAKDGRWKRPMF